MPSDYICVYTGGTGTITEKKSRFIASVRPITSEEEALSFIEEIKKANWDASHNCFAYVCGTDTELKRCSDDGEPQGTAGRPMLEAITHRNLKNTAVVVTRYFGGTLLGTGGLVRAYTDAVNAGLDASTIITKRYGRRLMLKTDYNGVGKLQYLAAESGVPILSSDYSDTVVFTVFVTPEVEKSFCDKLLEQTGGKISITQLENTYYASANGTGLLFDN